MPMVWLYGIRKRKAGIMSDSASEPNDVDQFLKKAKRTVELTVQDTFLSVAPEDLYIVWFAKTLGNWKALISTDSYTGLYWEVTYNGAKQETYVDRYIKESNIAISDEVF